MTQQSRDRNGGALDVERGATAVTDHTPSHDDRSNADPQRSGSRRPSGGGPQRLTPEVQALLGHKLRTLYGQLVEEPIPQSLLDLLKRLESPNEPNSPSAEENAQ